MQGNKIYIIGVAQGGEANLTAEARRLLKLADVVYGGKRLLNMVRRPGVEKVAIGNDLTVITDSIRMNMGLKRMVVVASGDPGFFGIAKYLAEELGKEMIEIIPNVSSMQVAFARIKENWDDASFVSAHARPMGQVIQAVRASSKVAVLTDNKNTPAKIAAELLRAGIADCRVYVCQDLGTASENVIETDLDKLKSLRLSHLCIMILIRKDTAKFSMAQQVLGIPETEFDQRKGRSLITKHEVRAISLAKLRLADSSVLWDIGAGSGSVSIEASAIAGKGLVYAIEESSADAAIIRRNIDKFARYNVELVQACAPDGLDELPDPTAVFIGGSGGRLEAIMDYACRRLRPHGRIVCNVATLENLSIAAERFKANGYTVEIIQVNIARSREMGSLTRLEPLNPVFILTANRSAV